MSSKQSVKNIGKYFKLLDFHVYDNKPILQTVDSDNSSVSDTSVVVGQEIQFTIQMFGLNESGETCCIYINDYNPFFYIKVGDDWDNNIAQDLLQ